MDTVANMDDETWNKIQLKEKDKRDQIIMKICASSTDVFFGRNFWSWMIICAAQILPTDYFAPQIIGVPNLR